MRTVTLLLAMVFSCTACGRTPAPPPADTGVPTPPPPAPKAPLTGELVHVGSAPAVFNAPAGWQRYPSGDWTRFKPADNAARLAFVTFDKPNESTRRLGQIAEQFELAEISWGEPRQEGLGKDQFAARAADSKSCTLKSGEACKMWYATVNPGGPEQILIVYLVVASKAAKEVPNARAAVQSLRRS